MNKDTLLSILRAVLTFAGTLLIGKNIFGHAVDSNNYEIVAGAIITVASTIWGIVDKSAGIEQIQSAVRSVIISIGGIFVSSGLIKGDTLNSFLGLATAIIPVIQSYTSKVKVQQMVSGQVAATATGKVVTQVPPKPDTAVVPDPKENK